MMEHITLDLSNQTTIVEVAASINRTISYSACYEIHSIHKPLHLNTVADFLVGIQVISNVSPSYPITINLSVSGIDLYQWNITEPHHVYLFSSPLHITETENHIQIRGLIPLLACNDSVCIRSSTPVVIQCIYMTSYSLYLRNLFTRLPVHMMVETEDGPVTYHIDRKKMLIKS